MNTVILGLAMSLLECTYPQQAQLLETLSLTEKVKLIDEFKSYVNQVLIDKRYLGTLSIVWVYGCADKN